MASLEERNRDAAEKIKDRDDIRFLLAGAGAERDVLIRDANRRRLENVVFMPAQPKEATPRVWSLCDVALVHLKNDPVFAGVIPSKIFEAMASGLCCIVTDVGDSAEIVGELGWISSLDAADLARRIGACLALDPGQRKARGEQARTRVVERYSIERQVHKYVDFYRMLVRRNDMIVVT